MSGKCWNCSPSLFSPALLITAHALAQIDSEHSQSCHFVRPVTQLSLWWARKESLFFRQNLCVNAKSERIGTMFICRTLQKPASVLSALCSVYKLLRLSLPSTQQALWLWRSLRRNVMLNSTLQTSGFWVEGAYHWFHSFYTAHMPGERGRERESAEGIPMGPSLLVSAKCLQRQLQTQVCVMLGKPAAEHQNHPKSSSDLQFTEVQWSPPWLQLNLCRPFVIRHVWSAKFFFFVFF